MPSFLVELLPEIVWRSSGSKTVGSLQSSVCSGVWEVSEGYLNIVWQREGTDPVPHQRSGEHRGDLTAMIAGKRKGRKDIQFESETISNNIKREPASNKTRNQ